MAGCTGVILYKNFLRRHLSSSPTVLWPIQAMEGNGDVSDDEYQKGLDALSSLISGRVRSDGKNWSHAFDMMQTYLEVSSTFYISIKCTHHSSFDDLRYVKN